MGVFTNILLGKASAEEQMPDKVEATEIKEAFDAHREETLKAVNGALDEKLSRFEPLLAKAEEDEKREKEKEEESKAIAAINKARIARGEKPLAEKDDDMDKKAPKEDYEKKSKSKSKSKKSEDDDKKENPFEKKDDDEKDARFGQIQNQLTELASIVKAVAHGKKTESTAMDVDALSLGGNKVTLQTSKRQIPFGDDWEFANNGSIALRQAIQSDPKATIDEINEFDVLVANLKHKLRSNGINPPVNSSRANGTVTHHFA